MAEYKKILTDSFVSGLRSIRGQVGWREVADAACRGLRLRISPHGERVWAVRNVVGGKRVRHTIGAYPEIALTEARKRAAAYRAASREGLDAAALDARTRAQSLTVTLAHTEYIGAMAAARVIGEKTRKLKESMFRAHIAPKIGALNIRSVRRFEVLQVVSGVADLAGNGLPVQKNRVFSEIMAFLRWCEQNQFIEGVPSIRKRDLRVLGAAKEQPRRRTLTESEILSVWQNAMEHGELTGDFLRLLLLTGQRRDEVRLMTWDEVDIDQATWTIAATRYKTRIDHVVPLPRQALTILAKRFQPGVRGYVLSGRQPGKPFNGAASAVRRLRKAMPSRMPFTLHDIRRTVRTGLSRLGVDDETAELVIGHLPQGIRRVYDQYDRMAERRAALQRWTDFVCSLNPRPRLVDRAA